MKPPRRMSRNRPIPTPAELDKLRRVRSEVNPWERYRHQRLDGEVVTITGADVIREVDAYVALVDASLAEDDAAIHRALQRIKDL